MITVRAAIAQMENAMCHLKSRIDLDVEITPAEASRLHRLEIDLQTILVNLMESDREKFLVIV